MQQLTNVKTSHAHFTVNVNRMSVQLLILNVVHATMMNRLLSVDVKVSHADLTISVTLKRATKVDATFTGSFKITGTRIGTLSWLFV